MGTSFDWILPNLYASNDNERVGNCWFHHWSAIAEAPQYYLEMEPWKLYFDGSSHLNGVGIWILIISPEKIPTKFKYMIDRFCSNNEVEYEALIGGLEILLDLGARRVEVKGESELVVKQVTKEYICIKENLIMYFVIMHQL